MGLKVEELDVAHRVLTKYGERAFPGGYATLSVSSDGSRAFARTTGEIVDGLTLAPIVKLVPKAGFGSSMLNDGSVVIVDKANGVVVRMFDRNGQPRGEVQLPSVKSAFLSAETTDGKLLVLTGVNGEERSMAVIDRNRAVVERVVSNVKGPMPQGFVDPRIVRYEAGQPFAGVDGTGKLKMWKAGA